MRLAELNFGDGDDSSLVFHGWVLQEPRVLALDELIPVEEVRLVCKGPEPAKNIAFCFLSCADGNSLLFTNVCAGFICCCYEVGGCGVFWGTVGAPWSLVYICEY